MGSTGERQWVTVPEAAIRLDISERAVLDMIKSKKVIAERATSAKGRKGVWLIYWPSVQNSNQR
jgi:hypothetical protein